ncbi:gluconate:H+ symporter [Streptomyces sp. NPDC088124]|uniref:GntP family permease n=1 Tax=Streptomyces sp. NPDC088124 TaxID=3154654 RepID=UPI0034354F09
MHSLVLAADGPIAQVGHGTLFIAAGTGVAAVILLITVVKMHPFIALLLGASYIGLTSGLGATGTLEAFTESFGSTMADVGILVALGAMLGKLLAGSGGADLIVDSVLARVSKPMLPWAMAGLSFLLGLPLFFEVGVVLIIPIALLAAKRTGSSPVLVALPALTALSLLNGFLVPHPGPLVAVSGLGADLGLALAIGIVIAIPTIAIGGPLFARLVAPSISANPPVSLVPDLEKPGREDIRKPRLWATLATLLMPVLLMLFHAVMEFVLPEEHPVRQVSAILGAPVVALLAGLLLGMLTLGRGTGMSRTAIGSVTGSGLPGIAGVLVVLGAGGGLKGVLVESGIGGAIGSLAEQLGIPIVLLAWLITAVVRIAVGSGTVAIVTSVGLLAPIAGEMGSLEATLLMLAIGAGSRFLSHVNDAGFWLVKEYLGISVKDTFKSWSAMDCIISVVALGFVLLAQAVLL